MPGAHAVLSPSAAKRWMTCPPSARLEERIKSYTGDKSSVFAEEGTLAHSLAELKLRRLNGEINDFLFHERVKALGEIPKEMDAATDYYESVIAEKWYAAKKASPDARMLVETRLDISDYAPKCYGTGDCIIVSDKLLEVCDLKYGKGVPVVAEHNPQARLYGLGAMKNELISEYLFAEVRNTIIQPRLDSVTEETLSTEELVRWGTEEVKPYAELAFAGKGEFKPGDHCRFCAAKAVCAARAREAMQIFDTGLAAPDLIDSQAIPDILRVLPVAKSWIKDIEAYALQQAVNGVQLDGWKLVRGKRPNRTWTDEEAVKLQLLRAGMTSEQIEKTTLRSPADIEKLIGKENCDALLGKLITQGDGKLELAPEDDRRVGFTSADAAFNDLTD